jgi:Tol biopolymer transport system component
VISIISGARQPNFRSDGQKLLVNAERGDQGEENIYEANPFTGSFERRVSDSDIDFHPFYNPAGDRVVYGRNDGQRFLYVQCDLTPPSQATVTGCKELTDIRLIPADPKEIWGTNPVWTADDHIVYKGCALDGNPCGLLQVESWAAKYYNNQTGLNPAQLVFGSTETIPTDTKANRVAYQDYDAATGDWEALVLLPTADRQIVKIAPSPGSAEGLPTLSPDGRWVAFVSNRDGEWAVYVASLEAGSAAVPVKLTTPPLRWDTRGDRDWKTERLSWGP